MRRGSNIVEALALTLLFVVACLPFSDALFDPGKIPAGLDLIQHYSRESFNRRALASGTLPLWNPYEFSGIPAQADPQTGVFYPPNVLLRILPLPLFLTWTIVFHVWLFGAGGYVLARTLGVGPAMAAMSAVGLMLGGITMPRIYAGHLDVLRTVTWAPLALACAVRSLDRRSMLPGAALVVVLCCQLLGSFLQAVCYTWICIGLYAVFTMAWPPDGRASWRRAGTVAAQLAILSVLVTGLTAFQLWPTARLVLAAGRTHGVPYDDAVVPAMGTAEFTRFFMPAFGSPSVQWENWEVSSYVGWLVAVAALFAFVAAGRRRLAAFFALLGGVALLFAMGGDVYRYHHALFPMFRIPGRMLFVWSVSMFALGAIALEWLHQRAFLSRKAQVAVACVLATIVLVDAFRYARAFVDVRSFENRFAMTLPFVPTPGGRVLSLCESKLHATELAAMGVLAVDGYNSYFLSDYARFAQYARREEPKARLAAFERIGSSPVLPDMRLVSMLNVTEVVSCEPLTVPGLDLIATREPLLVYRNTRAAGRVACRSAGCRGDVQISDLRGDTPDGVLRFQVVAGAAHVLRLSEPYYPERRAFVDGVEVPMERMNVALFGIRVEPGTHVVELRYVPTSLWYGAIVTLLTLVGWVVAMRRGGRGAWTQPPRMA